MYLWYVATFEIHYFLIHNTYPITWSSMGVVPGLRSTYIEPILWKVYIGMVVLDYFIIRFKSWKGSKLFL